MVGLRDPPTGSVNTRKKPMCGRKRRAGTCRRMGGDTARNKWREVTGICGFWDWSYDNGKCGWGIIFMAFLEHHGWFSFHKKCVLVLEHGFFACWNGWLRDVCWQFTTMDGKVRPPKACNCPTNWELRFRLCLLPYSAFFRWNTSHADGQWPSTPPLCYSRGVVVVRGVRRHGGKGFSGIEDFVMQLF